MYNPTWFGWRAAIRNPARTIRLQWFWWVKLSRAERRKAAAFAKMMAGLLTPKAISIIQSRQGGSWDISDDQRKQAMEGVNEYVAAHKESETT